jgi:hypothetical protein
MRKWFPRPANIPLAGAVLTRRQPGQVYRITSLLGVNLVETGSPGAVETNPVCGSFQVLVVGN